MKIHVPASRRGRQAEETHGLWAELWHRSAPVAVRRPYRQGREGQGWEAWVKHLAKRPRPLGLEEVFPGRTSPRLWAAHFEKGPEPLDRIAQLWRVTAGSRRRQRSTKAVVELWGGRGTEWASRAETALEALAWCYAMPKLAGELSQRRWRAMLTEWIDLVAEAERIGVRERPLIHQLLAGELPLTLSYLFPEITACRRLARPAKRALSCGLIQLCDGDGVLEGRLFPLLRPLLACWTRCRRLAEQMGTACWSRDAQRRYGSAVCHAVRLTRPDGSHAFSSDGVEGCRQWPVAGGGAGAWCSELFSAALEGVDGDRQRRLAALALPGHRRPRSTPLPQRLPNSAMHSERAGTSVLRAGWDARAPNLVALWRDRVMHVELVCQGRVVFSGAWQVEIRRNGRPLVLEDHWEEVCWVSDDEVDYLELEGGFSGGVRLQRHLVLARRDSILILADAVLGGQAAQWHYTQSLPLWQGVRFDPAADTHEGYLVGQRKLALVLPLGLPEWRTERAAGRLTHSQGRLQLCSQTQGKAFFAPLFFDLDPRRMLGPLTWRQLTVAQNRRIVTSDVAVGYRVMVGRQQWLVYRTLARPANRTLLGHNLITQLLVARFKESGEVEPLVEIE